MRSINSLLVTGGAGFIGQSLVLALIEKGCRVAISDTQERLQSVSELRRLGVEFVACEYPDISTVIPRLGQFDGLIHLATTTSPATSMKSFEREVSGNVLPSVRLFESAAQRGVKRIVFASSGGTVYGVSRDLPIQEDCACRPLNPYGITKRAIESYLSLIGESYDIDTVSLRISNPYGEYQLARTMNVGLIGAVVRKMIVGEKIDVWGDGSTVRDYIHVDDVVNAFTAVVAAGSRINGEYNVGTGRGATVIEIIEHVSACLGKIPQIEFHPRRNIDVPAVVLDSSKLYNAVGWRPKYPLEDGVAWMCSVANRRQL